MRGVRLFAAAVCILALAAGARAAASDALPDGVAAAVADDPQALFEFGRDEAQAGRLEAAAQAFRTLLARSDSPHVRLELARSLAALGRHDEALVEYRKVQAAHPPEPVAGWVASEMAALASSTAAPLDSAWHWHPRAGVGAIADSNVNAGPADASVQVFGLPFELSAASLAQRAVGAQGWVGLGATRAGEWGQWHADAQWSGTRYAHRDAFDTDTLGAQGGFSRAAADATLDVTLALESQAQRNGNGRDTVTLGAQGLRELTASSALAWLAAAGHVHQRQEIGADGAFAIGGASLNLRHARAGDDPAWLPAGVEALLGVRMLRESLQDGDRSHTDVTPQLALRTTTALCDGCTVTLDLTRTQARYDAVDPAFGVERRDRLRTVSLTLARAAAASTPSEEPSTSWQCVLERSLDASTLSAWTFDRTVLRCSREWSW